MNLRLRELRIVRNIKQQELARVIGCSPGAYSKYDLGDREPSIDILSKIADYYEVSLDYLVGRDNCHSEVLSHFEKRLVAASRQVPDYVCEYMLDFLEY